MDGPIEAKSLSSLNELADDPPTQLTPAIRRNIRGNLVLYIARVPGSRDVFLTTMKPRAKVVTAQDVESSLYYFHLETAADEAFRQSLNSLDVNEDRDEDPVRQDLLRPRESPKPQVSSQTPTPPLPARLERGPVRHLPEEQPPPLPSRLSEQSTTNAQPEVSTGEAETHKIRRKPIGGAASSSQNTAPSNRRQPLGPRPLERNQQTYERTGPAEKENVHPQLPPRRNTDESAGLASSFSGNIPSLAVRQSTSEWADSGIVRAAAPPPLPLRRESSFPETEAKIPDESGSASSEDSFITGSEFNVTVIRRDPVTDRQWNIGKITKESLEGSSKARQVDLEINSGAYDKFVKEDESMSHDSRPGPFEHTTFRRALNLRQRRLSPRASPVKSSYGSRSTGNSPTKSHAPISASHNSGPPFSFTSPWNGVCDFATGVAGRSLKCHHLYPVPDPQHPACFEPQLNSVPISELRFSLPFLKHRRHGSGSAPSKHRKPLSAHSAYQRHSFQGSSPRLSPYLRGREHANAPDPRLSREPEAPVLPPRPVQLPGNVHDWKEKARHKLSRSFDAASSASRHEADEDEDGDEWDHAVVDDYTAAATGAITPMDLRLGQERAGGGFGGNKAKLGKLLVQGEGVLMLDLVVLANMAVWWALTSD